MGRREERKLYARVLGSEAPPHVLPISGLSVVRQPKTNIIFTTETVCPHK
jgi:hypothetical protein